MSDEDIPQMRAEIDKLTDTNKSQAKEINRLQARDAFREAGYEANHGELYAAVNPGADFDREKIDAFVKENNLPLASGGSEGEGSGQEGSAEEGDGSTPGGGDLSGLADMSRGGSRPGDSAGGAATQVMTRQEWQELMAKDPVAGKEAVRQGRVAIDRDNPWSDSVQAAARGTNPYAASVQE